MIAKLSQTNPHLIEIQSQILHMKIQFEENCGLQKAKNKNKISQKSENSRFTWHLIKSCYAYYSVLAFLSL